MGLINNLINNIKGDNINLGPKENKRLNSLRRMAQRYADEDEEKALKAYIKKRQFEEGRAAFNKGEYFNNNNKKTINKKSDNSFIGKTNMI